MTLNYLAVYNFQLMKKSFLLTLIVSMVSIAGFSQQDPQYTNYMFSKMAFNPGYAGIKQSICATALMRQQWIGYQDQGNNQSPQTAFLTIDAPIHVLHGGIGLTVVNDVIGLDQTTGVRLGYSFHLNAGPGKLGIGIQGGAINKKIDFANAKPKDEFDPLLASKAVETDMNFDMAFGAYYNIPDKLYVGVSSTQLTEPTTDLGSLGSPEYVRHYYINGGYYYQLPSMPTVTINPNALIKTDFASAQFDLSVLGWYNNQIYAGVNYRVQDAISLMAGMEVLPNLRAGIAYDITTSQLGRQGRSHGTAEVYVNYCFKIVVPQKSESHGNVRFLY